MVYGSNVHFFACRGSKAMIIICPLMAGRRSRHWYGAPHPTPLAPVDRRRPTDRRPLTRRAPNAERRRHHNQQHHRQQQQSSTMPPPHHPTLILSLHRPPYKSIMHAHFRLLGAVSDRSPMTRRTERRLALQLFQRLRRQNDSDNHGETKKVTFCKLVRWQGVEEEVGEDWALKSECLCQGVAVVCCFALWYWFFARLLIHTTLSLPFPIIIQRSTRTSFEEWNRTIHGNKKGGPQTLTMKRCWLFPGRNLRVSLCHCRESMLSLTMLVLTAFHLCLCFALFLHRDEECGGNQCRR